MSTLRPDQYELTKRDLERSVSPLEAANLNNSVYDVVREQQIEHSSSDGFQEQIDLRTASSDNPAAVMELDMDGTVRYLSKNWETIVGTNIKKIMKRPVLKIIVGISQDDLNIFNNAIDHMVHDDCSYKVKFVTATNDRSAKVDSAGKLTPTNSVNELLSEDALQLAEQEAVEYEENDSDENYQSSLSSQLSNNGDIIELEAQGILIHDNATKLPSHSIWTIKPFIHVDVELTIPPKLINMLGFGSEIFEGYLSNLQELGIIDETAVPQPKLVLCRICEQNIPAWFIERHSDLCIVEHRFSEELQACHDAVAEQRNLILRITDSLWIQQQLQGSSVSIPSATSSTTSLSLNSSNSSMLLEYKGIKLPTPFYDTSSPKLANQSLQGTVVNPSPLGGSVTNSRPIGRGNTPRRFPFGILQRLLDLCDEVLIINPAESNESGQYEFSPNTKEALGQVEKWHTIETTDPALRAMVEDTQQLAKEKHETALRFLSMLQYSQKIKAEVDLLVLSVVLETVARIREQTSDNEKREPIMGLLKKENAADNLLPLPDLNPEANNPSKQNPNSVSSTSIHSPRPARALSPTFLVNQDANQSRTSITPHDILLRGHSSRLSSPANVSQNISPNDSRENIVEAFNDLELSKKTSLSNGSSYCSPRRHLSPAPYLEKGSLSSLQKNTNSRQDLSYTNPSSPVIEANNGQDYLSTPLASNEKRKSDSGVTNLHLNINQRFSATKPPLSPLLVSLTPTAKSGSGLIKDYEILKAISKGAFGSVFLAKRKLTGEYVAIKCLKKQDMIAKNQVLNVRSERAVMMKQADSPYVAQLYNTFQTKDYLYLVMEYLNGGDCATLLKMLGTLGNEWAKRYIAEVVVGVNDLHERGIIHRDLKPDNLLIDSKGHLKLTDFGLSRMGVVGRLTRPHRKSSISEQGVELFRKSLQGNQSPLANVVGLGLGSDDSPNSLQSASYDSASTNHKRVSSVTPFSLSPALETKDSKYTSSNFSNDSNKFRPGRSGSIAGLESPLVRPAMGRDSSDMSFPFDEDDFGTNTSGSISQQPTSYALYDPTEDKEIKHFVGTPDYLAPETIEGVGQSDASDWWSLGCMLFEFLYGYPPFHADTPDGVFKNILECNIDWPPLSPEEDREICPPSAKDLILKLLTLDPDSRLGSNGAQEIKEHPYFKEINWDTLFDEVPSFIPTLEDPESTDYFDSRGADISHFPHDDDEGDLYQAQSQLSPPLSALFGETCGSSLSGSGIRERRGSRLADPSEFGSFHFRNLSVLEKANKDVINRLKHEHLEHRGSFSSSSSDSTPLGRPRGLSLTSTPGGTSGSPFKRPLSPGALLGQRVPSPLKGEGSPAVTPSSQNFKHERVGSAVSTYSSGDEYPFETVKTPLSATEKTRSSNRHSLTKQVFTKSVSEFSPSSSSDTEDSISSALLRVRKRRESSKKPSGTSSLFSRNSSSDMRRILREIDVLYCEPIPIVRHTITKFLEDAGCIVVAVSNGDELIRRATSQVKFDIIFTALKIPKVDAVDAVKLIKYTSGINSNTPLVAITGYAKDAQQSGMFAEILEKPLDRGQLQQVIYRLSMDSTAVESDKEEE